MRQHLRKPLLRLAVMAVSSSLIWLSPGSPSYHASAVPITSTAPTVAKSDVSVVNTESVQIGLNAAGDVTDQSVSEFLSLTGSGTVLVENPVSTAGFRNLDGFGGDSLVDGKQVVEVDVDGQESLRSVSDYDEARPLAVEARYFLDGQEVDPEDVVDADGTLHVRYRVENVTGASRQLSYDDGAGGTATRDAEVAIPMVASLTTILPATFTDIESAEAAVSGEGHGGSQLTFLMSLVPPLGPSVAEFGYSASIEEGIVPGATLTALPVDPMDSETQPSQRASRDLTAAISGIDNEMWQVREGTSALLRGLMQLRSGADEVDSWFSQNAEPISSELADHADGVSADLGDLSDANSTLAAKLGAATDRAGGLADESDRLLEGADGVETAVGGVVERAGAIADGAGEFRDNTGRLVDKSHALHDGAGELAHGANRLAGGLDSTGRTAPQLLGGLGEIRSGLVSLNGGLSQLHQSIGDLTSDAKPLHNRIESMIARVGSTGSPGTLLGDLEQIRSVLRDQGVRGAQGMQSSLDCDIAALESALGGGQVPGCSGGGSLEDNLDAAHKSVLRRVIDDLRGVNGDMAGLESTLSEQAEDLVRVQCELSSTNCSIDTGLLQSLNATDSGLTQMVGRSVGRLQEPVERFRGGVMRLINAVDQVAADGQNLLTALVQLGNNASTLSTGTGQLSGGLGMLTGTSQELAGNAAHVVGGTKELAGQTRAVAGSVQQHERGATQIARKTGALAQTAQQLNATANQAVAGSMASVQEFNRLAAGTDRLAGSIDEAAVQADQLSQVEMRQLMDSGAESTTSIRENYALIQATALRGHRNAMAFGAPTGAHGMTTYTYELAGEDGEEGNNVVRGIAALALFALALAAGLLRRRWRSWGTG